MGILFRSTEHANNGKTMGKQWDETMSPNNDVFWTKIKRKCQKNESEQWESNGKPMG
jgi:hypothetical protein